MKVWGGKESILDDSSTGDPEFLSGASVILIVRLSYEG